MKQMDCSHKRARLKAPRFRGILALVFLVVCGCTKQTQLLSTHGLGDLTDGSETDDLDPNLDPTDRTPTSTDEPPANPLPETGNGESTDPVPVSTGWKALPLRSPAQLQAGLEGGEGFQMIQSMAYAQSNPETVYLVVDTSQVWKSTNGGSSWISKRNGFQANGGVSIGVDPKNENVIFVSGGLASGGSDVDGIYRSTDGGESWKLVQQTYYSKIEPGYDYGQGQHYVFDPSSFDGTQHQTIYAATNKAGLLRSLDGGVTWSVIALSGERIVDLDSVTINGQITLYAATGSGIYKIKTPRTTATSTKIGAGLNLTGNYPRSIAIDADNVNQITIYAAMGTDKIYKSTDGGANFAPAGNSGLPSSTIYQLIEITPTSPRRLYARAHLSGRYNPYVSTDGGATWSSPSKLDLGLLTTKSTAGSGNTYHGTPVIPHPTDPNVALANLNNTIMKTTDGGKNWEYSGNGYMGGRRAGNGTSAFFDPSNPNKMIFFLIDHGPIVTMDGGESWSLLPPPYIDGTTSQAGTVDPTNPDLVITATGDWTNHTLVRSTDGGQTWQKFTSIVDQIIHFSFDSYNPNTVYIGGVQRSLVSSNKGLSWQEIPGKTILISTLGSDGKSLVYARGEDSSGDLRIWKSLDYGGSWSQIGDASFNVVNDLEIDPFDPHQLVVASSGGIYRFNGTSWSQIARNAMGGFVREDFNGKTNFNVESIAMSSKDPGTIFAGLRCAGLGHCTNFIYRSTDYGKTWAPFLEGLTGYSNVWSLDVDPRHHRLHMSLDHGNYVYDL